MKDSKFIELLNLYVDHQIGAEDAALLEAEIQRTPERRRIYREYCQMQKACVLLAENFRSPAPTTGKLVEFPEVVRSRSRLNFATYAMGALAAAACVTLVMVERTRFGDRIEAAQSTVTAAAANEAAAATPSVGPAAAPVRAALQPAFAGLVKDSPAVNTSLAANVPLDWLNRVQLQRVSTDELWFESRPAAQPDDFIFRHRAPADSQTKMAAFRFQR